MSEALVRTVGPVVTILPVREQPFELWPCRFCGSTGRCEHLVDVIWLEDKGGDLYPVGVRAELGVKWGRRRLEALKADLIRLWLDAQGEAV